MARYKASVELEKQQNLFVVILRRHHSPLLTHRWKKRIRTVQFICCAVIISFRESGLVRTTSRHR